MKRPKCCLRKIPLWIKFSVFLDEVIIFYEIRKILPCYMHKSQVNIIISCSRPEIQIMRNKLCWRITVLSIVTNKHHRWCYARKLHNLKAIKIYNDFHCSFTPMQCTNFNNHEFHREFNCNMNNVLQEESRNNLYCCVLFKCIQETSWAWIIKNLTYSFKVFPLKFHISNTDLNPTPNNFIFAETLEILEEIRKVSHNFFYFDTGLGIFVEFSKRKSRFFLNKFYFNQQFKKIQFPQKLSEEFLLQRAIIQGFIETF